MKIKLELDSAERIIQKKGLNPSGKIQKMLTNEVMTISERFEPRRNGFLSLSKRMDSDGTSFTYHQLYARFLWYGKLMIGMVSRSPFAQRGEQKELAQPEVDLNFRGAPIRGSKWANRAWDVDGGRVLSKMNKEANK